MKIKLHELPKMASCRFNYENSALRTREYPPMDIRLNNGELEITPSSPYTPVGWTDQPPFHTKWEGKENVVAVMFEDREFNQIWCHYLSGSQGGPRMTGKVLLIEDEPMLVELTSVAFEQARLLCTTAVDGWDALDLIMKDTYDVIITDIEHPGPDGIELLMHIRQLVSRVPVIVLSGYPNSAYSDECLRTGAFAYMEKPCAFDEILVAIEKAISTRVAVPTDALSEDRISRYRAVIARGKRGDHKSIHDLITCLTDNRDPILRALAATALGEIGNPAWISALTAALNDKSRDVAVFAALAIGKIGDPASVPVLMASLRDGHWAVRRKAAFALGKIGDTSSVPALAAALSDQSWSVRSSVIEALGKIGDPVAVPALSGALKDEDSLIRSSAVETLGIIGGPAAFSALLEALSDEDKGVRGRAAEEVNQLRDSSSARAIQALTATLCDAERDELIERCMSALHEKDQSTYLSIFTNGNGLEWKFKNFLFPIHLTIELLLHYLDDQSSILTNLKETDKLDELQCNYKKWLIRLPIMVSKMLAHSRAITQLHEIEEWKSEIDINFLLTCMVEAFRTNAFFYHSVNTELDLAEKLPKIKIQGGDLVLAFFHLLQNAIKALKQSSRRKITIQTRVQSNEIVLKIMDSGCGWPGGGDPEVLFDLFESRWEEPEIEAASPARHLGFGLYAARQLLLPYGFIVRLERAEERTAAVIRIPLSPPLASGRTSPAAGFLAGSKDARRDVLIERCMSALLEKDRLNHRHKFLLDFTTKVNEVAARLTFLKWLLDFQDKPFNSPSEEIEKRSDLLCKQRKCLTEMQNQVCNPICDVREFMKSYEIELHSAAIDINSLLMSVLKVLQVSHLYHQIKIELRLAENLPVIKILGTDVVPALHHLFENAITALDQSQEKELIVQTGMEGQAIVIIITDSGCGLPEGVQPEILFGLFESRWQKSDNKALHTERHLGFGLFAARQLLLPYGFTVALERVDKGTSVLVRMPITHDWEEAKNVC